MGVQRDTRKEVDIKCPFYKRHDRSTRRIRCEGAESGSYSETVFKNQQLWEKHMERLCESFNYDRCPVFEMIYKTKYKQ